MSARGREAVITGVGRTAFSRSSGRTPLAMAAEACRAALDDAGLCVASIDGMGTYAVNDSPRSMEVAYAIGVDGTRFNLDLFGGGQNSPFLVGQTMLAIESGVCDAVLLYRALNGRSGVRFSSGSGTGSVGSVLQFGAPHGYMVPAQWFALWARAHMERYGTTEEDLGQIAVLSRTHATRNPHALMRSPITLEDYLASRWINEPFRLLDCALEADGAVALLVTTRERARDLRQVPVQALARQSYMGAGGYVDAWPDMTEMYSAKLADALFRQAGLLSRDVDVACLYDCFTYTALCTAEDFGFCAKGQGGAFFASGGATYGGDVVINPHGGLLSEGYIHGFNHHYEAVVQLRGQAAERQVANARVALVSGGGPAYGSAIVYARE
ncbi:MAG: nonspecific lipid-transfer protein [Pseudomonadota bacterium]|nr:nonspecific lipid-transfer protein [Pseudomonadota bacterium]